VLLLVLAAVINSVSQCANVKRYIALVKKKKTHAHGAEWKGIMDLVQVDLMLTERKDNK